MVLSRLLLISSLALSVIKIKESEKTHTGNHTGALSGIFLVCQTKAQVTPTSDTDFCSDRSMGLRPEAAERGKTETISLVHREPIYRSTVPTTECAVALECQGRRSSPGYFPQCLVPNSLSTCLVITSQPATFYRTSLPF